MRLALGCGDEVTAERVGGGDGDVVDGRFAERGSWSGSTAGFRLGREEVLVDADGVLEFDWCERVQVRHDAVGDLREEERVRAKDLCASACWKMSAKEGDIPLSVAHHSERVFVLHLLAAPLL